MTDITEFSTGAKDTCTCVDQRCSGNFIGAGALLGIFAYMFVGNVPSFTDEGGRAEQIVSGNSWYVLVYLLLPTAREVNCPLLQATVNAKLGPHLAYTSVLVFFWRWAVFFCVFRSIFWWFRGLVVQPSTSGFTIISHFFLSVARDSPTVDSGPFSATFSAWLKLLVMPLTADSRAFKKEVHNEQVSHLHDK